MKEYILLVKYLSRYQFYQQKRDNSAPWGLHEVTTRFLIWNKIKIRISKIKWLVSIRLVFSFYVSDHFKLRSPKNIFLEFQIKGLLFYSGHFVISKSELWPCGDLKERNCPSFAGRTDYLLYLERYFTRRMYSFTTKNRKKKSTTYKKTYTFQFQF